MDLPGRTFQVDHCQWSGHDALIVHSNPSRFEIGIDLNPRICVTLSICARSSWYLELSDESVHSDQNIWDHNFDYNGTGQLNSPWCFTRKNFKQRIMLLKLRSDEFPSDMPSTLLQARLDQIRYNTFGPANAWHHLRYSGGDVRSWQRYTLDLPIGSWTAKNRQMQCTLSSPLVPSIWYAVVLLHSGMWDGPIAKGVRCRTTEDVFIPFKTVSTESNVATVKRRRLSKKTKISRG